MKKALLIFSLLFTLLFTLCSCDTPEPPPPEEGLELIVDGEAKFVFVLSNSLKAFERQAVERIIASLNDRGISVDKISETEESGGKTEVLVGDVTKRGEECKFDFHTLGYKGEGVFIKDGRIFIVGGSTNALINAINYFGESVIADKTSVIFLESDNYKNVQDDYIVTELKIGDSDVKDGYVIVADGTDKDILALAKKFQEALYIEIGAWLPITDSASSDRAIVFERNGLAGEHGFRVLVEGKTLRFDTEFPHKASEDGGALDKFIKKEISEEDGSVKLRDGFEYKVNVRSIYYSEFGAKGDGKTDDFNAMCKAHAYANEYGHTVRADNGARYYIGVNTTSLTIKTDTFFGDAEIILDDRDIDPRNSSERSVPTFVVERDRSKVPVTDMTSLYRGETNVGFAPGYPALLYVKNSGKKVFIRVGANTDSGEPQQDVILIDKDGNIDPTTPLLFDYDKITEAYLIPISDKPITISGGTFTCISNVGPSEYLYYYRGFLIERSNVTFEDFTYRITGEGDTGSPYAFFVRALESHNVLIDNATVDAHKMFALGGNGVGMGSYIFEAQYSTYLTWSNITQTNFYGSDGRAAKGLGPHGTSGCKNMTFDGNLFTSFDAHRGSYNVTIKNSELEHISIIGEGRLLIENSKIHATHTHTVVGIRKDYGSDFDGEFVFKNVTVEIGDYTYLGLVDVVYANHDFGYETSMPHTITVDNLKLVKDGAATNVIKNVMLCTGNLNKYTDVTVSGAALKNEAGANVDADSDGRPDVNVNPYKVTEKLIIKNNTEDYGFTVYGTEMFESVSIIYE